MSQKLILEIFLERVLQRYRIKIAVVRVKYDRKYWARRGIRTNRLGMKAQSRIAVGSISDFSGKIISLEREIKRRLNTVSPGFKNLGS
jgi:hypothetical protein